MACGVIRVYAGEGSTRRGVLRLCSCLKQLLEDKLYNIQTVMPAELIKGGWEEGTVLLIFGGGYDQGYQQALGTVGMDRVRQYVQEGGSYLGLCAGGYFGSEFVEFDKGGPLEVCGERYLKFFPGKCLGPTFPGFKYKSEDGARAVKLKWLPTGCNDRGNHDSESSISRHRCRKITTLGQKDSNIQTVCYYNGGGYFVSSDTSDPERCTPLASYEEHPDKPPAIVLCRCQTGTAILTGVHLEFAADDLHLDLEKENQRIIAHDLKLGEQLRKEMFREVLQLLGLVVDT